MTGTSSGLMQLFVIVLIAGNVLALVVGLSLLIVPRKIVTLFSLNSVHPMSVRRVTKTMEKQGLPNIEKTESLIQINWNEVHFSIPTS